MPASDYTSTISGGLKLKGGAKDAGVKKKKSKKSKAPKEGKEAKPASENEERPQNEDEESAERKVSDTAVAFPDEEREVSSYTGGSGKTETQRRHEEIKRKRLDERLKREGGAKTHKQRVEELNKYLSTLSEHHDMPRIGPG